MGYYGAITLDELISVLRKLPKSARVRGLDGKIHSWRGSYEMNATFPDTNDEMFAHAIADSYASEIGKDMQGWKGGNFVVRGDQEVFYASEGTTGEAIIGVTLVPDGTYIPATEDID